jgi:hypothetical protein
VITTALSNTDTITATFTNTGNNSAVSALVFSGPTTFDGSSTGVGIATDPISSGSVSPTSACALLFGVVAARSANNNPQFTEGGGYTAAGGVTAGSTYDLLNPEYRIVTSLGSYIADGTLSPGVPWGAAVAAYK